MSKETIRTLRAENKKLREENARLTAVANAKLEEFQLLKARCAKHRHVPQINSNEESGAECGACIAEGAR